MFILMVCVLLSGLVEIGTYSCPSTAPLYFPDPWMYPNPWRCISAQECRRKSYVVYGRTCVHSCPPRTFYQQETSTCYNTCPVYTIRIGSRCLNGTYCVSKNKQVLFNGTCVPSCPSSAPFTKDGSCRKECPADTVKNVSDCVSPSDCIDSGYFIDNKTCVKACPTEKQSILHGVCHSSCPPDQSVTANRTECLSKKECTHKLGHFIYNNTCVPECPSTSIFSDQGSCTALCPKEKYVLGTRCILNIECVSRNRVLFRNECIAACPAEAPHTIDNVCYSTCPKNYVLDGEACIGLQQCISTRGLYKVVFNNTCLDSCPPAAPLNHQGLCVQSCPNDTVAADMQCVDSSMCLGSSRFISNGTCVSECPGPSPYVARGYCYPACPKDFVVTTPEQFQCISETECVMKKNMVFNKTCTTSCPKESPYTRTGYCYHSCPQGTASLPDMKCVSYQDCKTRGNFVQESKCLHECPSALPYRFHDKCISECPHNTSIFPDNKCVSPSECPTIKDAVMYNGSCLPTCPSFAPYVHSRNCLSKCPTGYFGKGSDCRKNYECQNILYNGSCLSSCPKEAPNRKDSDCYSNCPPETYIYQATCIDQYDCQEKKFYLSNGSCVPTCPSGSAGFTDYVCHPLIYVYQAIKVTPFLLLMVLVCLFLVMYNPKKSRLMNAPTALQREQLVYRECDMVECVTSDHSHRQQQDNADPYEGYMEHNSDDELLPLEDHRNNPHNVDIGHGAANYSNDVIVHPQRDDDEDVPLLQAASEDDPLIRQADDAFLFGDGIY
ncbi:prion-like-(Q/N-rich) domain-bearing protein 25 [Haliotis asinina]|uniref:prion-like-(Q/N-rich) domain-bearing protein 25 n=1 Tax=Haliotis asinina TaxID=109174 RepID=UPI003531B57F